MLSWTRLMTASRTSPKKLKNKERSEDLSKNHQRNIRYRERIQNDKEADDEIRDFIKRTNDGVSDEATLDIEI